MPEDDIGPDGFVRLRGYLPLADTHWFAGTCIGCGRDSDISVAAAIQAMGTPEATVGELARRLRCSACGERRVVITVAVDTRPAELRKKEGRPPQAGGQ